MIGEVLNPPHEPSTSRRILTGFLSATTLAAGVALYHPKAPAETQTKENPQNMSVIPTESSQNPTTSELGSTLAPFLMQDEQNPQLKNGIPLLSPSQVYIQINKNKDNGLYNTTIYTGIPPKEFKTIKNALQNPLDKVTVRDFGVTDGSENINLYSSNAKLIKVQDSQYIIAANFPNSKNNIGSEIIKESFTSYIAFNIVSSKGTDIMPAYFIQAP
jgi:hypothetical protein